MKTTDFIKEGYIADDADAMHKDHEVQMARQDCYNAAKDAIELHKLLKSVSEMQGLEGWVSEKLTLAADYLKTVRQHLEYEMMSKNTVEPVFSVESAQSKFDDLLNETTSASIAVTSPALGAPAKPGAGKPAKINNALKTPKVKIGKGVF